MKIILGLIVSAGLVLGAWALFVEGERESEALSLTKPVIPSAAVEAPSSTLLEASEADEVIEPPKTVLEIDTEKVESVSPEGESKSGAQTSVKIEVLDESGDAPGSNAPNKVQKALENILGGTTVLGGPTTEDISVDELAANLEHDAIKNEAWDRLDDALTVEGFDGLAISQAVIGPSFDDETKEAIRSLVIVGEENPEQIPFVVAEIRRLLGL